MSKYHFYSNDSHFYAFPKLDPPLRTLGEQYYEHVLLLDIHARNIKPIFVNCSVAPLAADCSRGNATLAANTTKQSFISDAPNSSNPINQILGTLTRQHQQAMIIGIIFLVLLFLILSFGLRLCCRSIRRGGAMRSYDKRQLTNPMEEQLNVGLERIMIDEAAKNETVAIALDEYTYLPLNGITCTDSTCTRCSATSVN